MKSLSSLPKLHTGVDMNGNPSNTPFSRSPLGLGTMVVPLLCSPPGNPGRDELEEVDRGKGLRASHPFAGAIVIGETIVHNEPEGGSAKEGVKGIPPPPRKIRLTASRDGLRVPRVGGGEDGRSRGKQRPSTADPRLRGMI
jgi:hypothetical protein